MTTEPTTETNLDRAAAQFGASADAARAAIRAHWNDIEPGETISNWGIETLTSMLRDAGLKQAITTNASQKQVVEAAAKAYVDKAGIKDPTRRHIEMGKAIDRFSREGVPAQTNINPNTPDGVGGAVARLAKHHADNAAAKANNPPKVVRDNTTVEFDGAAPATPEGRLARITVTGPAKALLRDYEAIGAKLAAGKFDAATAINMMSHREGLAGRLRRLGVKL